MNESIFENLKDDVSRMQLRNILLEMVQTTYRMRPHHKPPAYIYMAINDTNLRPRKFEYREVRDAYHDLQNKLNARYPNACRPTPFEDKAAKLIKDSSSLEIIQSAWIGTGCFDIFIPGLAGAFKQSGSMRGLVIEVNGPIHNIEEKMRRDDLKSAVVDQLRIAHTTIHNNVIKQGHTADLLAGLNISKRLDTRARQRLWRDIYLTTLVMHANDEELSRVLHVSRKAVENVRGVMG